MLQKATVGLPSRIQSFPLTYSFSVMHCAFWQGQAELSPAREKKGSKVYTVDGRIPGAEQQMEVAE